MPSRHWANSIEQLAFIGNGSQRLVVMPLLEFSSFPALPIDFYPLDCAAEGRRRYYLRMPLSLLTRSASPIRAFLGTIPRYQLISDGVPQMGRPVYIKLRSHLALGLETCGSSSNSVFEIILPSI